MEIEIKDYQLDNEAWVEKHKDDLNWNYISWKRVLNEDFIERWRNYVDWVGISYSQKISETFIEKYKDCVDWYCITKYQKLGESFIEKNTDIMGWPYISIYQKLSENFIENHWSEFKSIQYFITNFQKLSDDFISKYQLFTDKNNWLYKDTKFKKKQVIDTGLYECHDDYFIAYKGIRRDRYSNFNFQYCYLIGETYTCHADYTDAENSFGLSVWTKEQATCYCGGLVIKVKVYYEDVARVVHDGGKIRCSKLTVLD